nr:unnamed protein product [Callosobruchus analis]
MIISYICMFYHMSLQMVVNCSFISAFCTLVNFATNRCYEIRIRSSLGPPCMVPTIFQQYFVVPTTIGTLPLEVFPVFETLAAQMPRLHAHSNNSSYQFEMTGCVKVESGAEPEVGENVNSQNGNVGVCLTGSRKLHTG